jgi:SAM-dependent methyltransferase
MSLPANCHLCGADQSHQQVKTSHVYKGGQEYAFFCCAICDVIYKFPEWSQEEMNRFYTNEFENFMSERAGISEGWEDPEHHIIANQHQVKRRMKYLSPYLPAKNGRVLEIGCSSGFMLFPLAEAGYFCNGIDPSNESRKFVHSKGIDCFSSLDELEKSMEGEKGFDLIMHFFVLDYLTNPLEFLKDQIKLLNPNGKIVFEIPCVEDALITVYDIPAYERFVWSVEHSFCYTKSSLTFLLSKVGLNFEVLREQRYDLSNHMIWARDGKPGGLGAFTDFLGQDIEDQYRKALIDAGKSDALLGIIKNNS